MALTQQNLVGYLRAEYKEAGALRMWQFILQILIAIPAALSVVVVNEKAIYFLSALGLCLLAGWWVVNTKYSRKRDAAHSARRASFILGVSKLGFSPSEVMSLKARLTVSELTASINEKNDYYASTEPPGAVRLGEMLQESSFYSEALQRKSADTMLTVLAIFGVLAAVTALSSVQFLNQANLQIVFRLIMSVFVFVMSSDILGAYLAHKSSAERLKELNARLMTADIANFPMPDLLLAMVDYNAAVESAPESVPFAYSINERDLNRKWASYKKDRAAVRKAANRAKKKA